MTDTTDRELLGRAAKAAGIEFRPGVGGGIWIPSGSHLLREWNPLTDDGDALRLAVKLGLRIRVANEYGTTSVNGVNTTMHYGDPYAATRLAIVCAAAEIGKAMP